MADFDLTQTDQQVQNILNDAQGAMGASAQTTLTTEYVMLKDTNGVYHKILKSSFTEAIRDVLAGLLVNNDKGTTINQIAAIASGDFGSVTPANLASVLGGAILINGSVNDIKTPGVYNIGSTNTDAPTQYCTLVVYKRANVIVQVAYGAIYTEVYERIWESNQSVWKPWVRMDNFGCSTASELASLLGAYIVMVFDDEADFVTKSESNNAIGGLINGVGFVMSFKVFTNSFIQFKFFNNILYTRLHTSGSAAETWIPLL